MRTPSYDVSFGSAAGRRIEVVAGSRGIWKFRFVCGERPIQPGGAVSIFCEVPKFWLAVNPQRRNPAREEYAWASATEGVRFTLRDLPRYYKNLCWGRIVLPDGLREGQEVALGMGSEAAPAIAIAHMYPEVPISVRVDYFADRKEWKLWPPIVISVVPGSAAKLCAVLPSVVRAGETYMLKARAEDAGSNIGARLGEELHVTVEGPAGSREELCAVWAADGTARIEGLIAKALLERRRSRKRRDLPPRGRAARGGPGVRSRPEIRDAHSCRIAPREPLRQDVTVTVLSV